MPYTNDIVFIDMRHFLHHVRRHEPTSEAFLIVGLREGCLRERDAPPRRVGARPPSTQSVLHLQSRLLLCPYFSTAHPPPPLPNPTFFCGASHPGHGGHC